jgi:cathepsin B
MIKIFLVALVAVVIAASNDLVINQDVIDQINNDPTSTWKAARYEMFENKTFDEIKYLFGTYVIPNEVSNAPDVDPNVPIADEFDGRQKWGKCIHAIRNQAKCGSCWAFASSESLSDRFCIATGGSVDVVLSPQDQVSCDRGNMACRGGYLEATWRYLERTGTVADSCFPYTSGTNGQVPACRTTCVNGQPFKKYKAKNIIMFRRNQLQSVQQALMSKGPMMTGYMVYSDFMSYKSGVYIRKSGKLEGGHAVKVVGWGVEAGTPYWLVANSWGPTWGLSGYFKIRRGTNECGFEDGFCSGDAAN